MKKLFWIYSITILLFLFDRTAKWVALHLLPREGVFIIPQMTGFMLERNQGIAYSLPLPPPVLVGVTSLIIIVVMAMLVRAHQRNETEVVFACSLIMVGALSNFFDRLRFGFVVDMIVLTSWPVFNLADVMILAGTLWLGLKVLFNKKKPTGT